VSAIARALVAQQQVIVVKPDAGVDARDEGVVDLDLAFRLAANAKRPGDGVVLAVGSAQRKTDGHGLAVRGARGRKPHNAILTVFGVQYNWGAAPG
jgi:hypothetical protein